MGVGACIGTRTQASAQARQITQADQAAPPLPAHTPAAHPAHTSTQAQPIHQPTHHTSPGPHTHQRHTHTSQHATPPPTPTPRQRTIHPGSPTGARQCARFTQACPRAHARAHKVLSPASRPVRVSEAQKFSRCENFFRASGEAGEEKGGGSKTRAGPEMGAGGGRRGPEGKARAGGGA